MYTLGQSVEQRPEAALSAAFRKLHGVAAALAQLKQGYEQTKDVRYLQGVRNTLPLYERGLREYGAIAVRLGKEERPAQFMMVLASTGEWLQRQGERVVEGAVGTVAAVPTLVKNLTNPLVLIALAGAVIAVFSGKLPSFKRGRK